MKDKRKIEKFGWRVEVDLEGGRIISLMKDREGILGNFERMDGKMGNTHVCIPIIKLWW